MHGCGGRLPSFVIREVAVQGQYAVEQVTAALELDAVPDVDVIVLEVAGRLRICCVL